MRKIVLDFTGIRNRDDLHQYLKERFGFPEYYGENLDALYDVLTEPMEETEIVFAEDRSGFPRGEEMRSYLERVRKVFEDAAEENGSLHQ